MVNINDIWQDPDPNKDLGRKRTLKTETCIITFECRDPYGFWKISTDKGTLPVYLRGEYTTFASALRDVNRYVNDQRLNILAASDNEELKPIDRTSAIPELKYKKARATASD